MSPEIYVVAHPFRHGGKRYAEGDSCAGVTPASFKALLRSGWIRPLADNVMPTAAAEPEPPQAADDSEEPRRSFFRRAPKPVADDAPEDGAEE